MRDPYFNGETDKYTYDLTGGKHTLRYILVAAFLTAIALCYIASQG